MKTKIILLLILCLGLLGCGKSETPTTTKGSHSGESQSDKDQSEKSNPIKFARLEEHIKVLSSDEFEGRKPASPSEEKTVNYIREQFRKLNLKPGNGDSYFQPVPLVSITADSSAVISVKGKGYTNQPKYEKDIVVWSKRVVEKSEVNDSEMVFVGYGIVAPEYGWNDYDGLDVKGKTVVVLVNDPGYATQDKKLFNGNAMTYYGRWTYKYEEAARQGAAAAIIIHETGAAGYDWGVVRGWTGPQFDLVTPDNNMSRVAVEGWVSLEVARQWFKAAGFDYDGMKEAASKKGFSASSLNLSMTVKLDNKISTSDSRNVIGLLPGAVRPDEYIIYMAHWDHFGKDPGLEGDQIFNGALDNATGTAALITLAESYAQSLKKGKAPGRSILFMAVTAEESGLLGSKFYANNPVYPLKNTVAAINMDGLNVFGRMKDIVVVGYGNSELEEYLKDEAKRQGRYVVPNPTPEKGSFYRSDHLNLAKGGVPALYAKGGVDSIDHGREWGLERWKDYVANRYHKPSDEYDPNWDLEGMREDLELYFRIGLKIAGQDTFPNWYEGNEFRSIRDKSRQQ
ncbi:MAG: M28 family peptidase [bacterium]|nr:M28 family peptidase [bacterium]